MPVDQVSAIVALLSAIAAFCVTVYGVAERNRQFSAQQAELERQAQRWKAQFDAERIRQEVLLTKEFLLEQYRHRLASYARVLHTLGAVSDVMIPEGLDAYQALHENVGLLRSTADALYDHLYGEPGLLMTMATRNALHTARRQCLIFIESQGTHADGDELVNAFFYARRYLRADLELLDDRSPENLRQLVEKLRLESASADAP